MGCPLGCKTFLSTSFFHIWVDWSVWGWVTSHITMATAAPRQNCGMRLLNLSWPGVRGITNTDTPYPFVFLLCQCYASTTTVYRHFQRHVLCRSPYVTMYILGQLSRVGRHSVPIILYTVTPSTFCDKSLSLLYTTAAIQGLAPCANSLCGALKHTEAERKHNPHNKPCIILVGTDSIACC